jgi:ABC-type nitrate/sulfonate/bicarbonate transport system permease component
MKNTGNESSTFIIVRNLTLPVLLIVLWQLWALALPTGSPAPTPIKVVQTLGELLSKGDLVSATVQSLGRVLTGFSVASMLGIVLGLIMGSSQAVRENLDPARTTLKYSKIQL